MAKFIVNPLISQSLDKTGITRPEVMEIVGFVQVGIGGDYPNIYQAIADGHSNLMIISDIDEQQDIWPMEKVNFSVNIFGKQKFTINFNINVLPTENYNHLIKLKNLNVNLFADKVFGDANIYAEFVNFFAKTQTALAHKDITKLNGEFITIDMQKAKCDVSLGIINNIEIIFPNYSQCLYGANSNLKNFVISGALDEDVIGFFNNSYLENVIYKDVPKLKGRLYLYNSTVKKATNANFESLSKSSPNFLYDVIGSDTGYGSAYYYNCKLDGFLYGSIRQNNSLFHNCQLSDFRYITGENNIFENCYFPNSVQTSYRLDPTKAANNSSFVNCKFDSFFAITCSKNITAINCRVPNSTIIIDNMWNSNCSKKTILLSNRTKYIIRDYGDETEQAHNLNY